MRLLMMIGLLLTFCKVEAQSVAWQNPAEVRSGVELPRNVFMSYSDRTSALTDQYAKSLYYQELSGEWCFRQYDSETMLPTEVLVGELSQGWTRTTLPTPQTGLHSPQSSVAGEVPVTIYKTRFKMPFAWEGREIIAHLDGVHGAAEVYVNGQRVGMAQDAGSPLEFDVTSMVQVGLNTLAIVISPRSATSVLNTAACGSYAPGIGGPVYLIAEPKVRMRDYVVSATLDESGKQGALTFGVVMKSQFLNPKTVTVYCDVISPFGNLLTYREKDADFRFRSEDTIRFDYLIDPVEVWNAETPNLYTVLIRVKYEDRFTQYVPVKIGFRDVRTSGEQLLVNGKAISFKGVRYPVATLIGQDSTPEACVSTQLKQLKQWGVNALLCCGGEQPQSFYALCDRHGFYVFNEPVLRLPLSDCFRLADDTLWLPSYLDRIRRMYETSKSHPSSVGYSLGEGSVNGYNFYESYQMLKKAEPLRPIFYSGGALAWNSDLGILCAMDPAMLQASAAAPGRPFLAFDYPVTVPHWAQVTRGCLQGGFASASLSTQEQKTLQQLYVPVKIEPVAPERGIYKITNNMDFTGLGRFEITYAITSGRKKVRSGVLDLKTMPRSEQEVNLPISVPRPLKSGAYQLEITLSWRDADAHFYADRILWKQQFAFQIP